MSELRRQIAAATHGWSEPEPDTVEGRFRFPAAFVGFEGHFPGYPVLPALVQVLAAQHAVEAARGGSLRLVGVENAKFLIQLGPEQEIRVRCRQRSAEGELRVEARLTVGEGVAASFVLKFEEGPR